MSQRDIVTEGPRRHHGFLRSSICLCHEPTFRLNESNCERHTEDRLDDLFWAMAGKTITYKELTT